MTNKSMASKVLKFARGYIKIVKDGFDARWSQIDIDIYDHHMHQAIGGLLSRQATLAIEMAQSPSTWTQHSAPLFIRCMADGYITLAWILDDPEKRSKEYILYGLGQEKLSIEYMEKALHDDPDSPLHDDPDSPEATVIEKTIRLRKAWLNAQQADWSIDVNLGSWSGVSARKMAKEVDEEGVYKFGYASFSGSVHNMWQHVGMYNMIPCMNPLHKGHLVPKIRELPIDEIHIFLSAQYISRSYFIFDEKMKIKCDVTMPDKYFIENFPWDGNNKSND